MATTVPEILSLKDCVLGRTVPHLSLLVYERRSHFPECLALLHQDGWSCPWVSTQGNWETPWWRWALPGNRQEWGVMVGSWLVLSSQKNTTDWLGCLIHLGLAFSPLWRLKVHGGCAHRIGFPWDLSHRLGVGHLLLCAHAVFHLCVHHWCLPLCANLLFVWTPLKHHGRARAPSIPHSQLNFSAPWLLDGTMWPFWSKWQYLKVKRVMSGQSSLCVSLPLSLSPPSMAILEAIHFW